MTNWKTYKLGELGTLARGKSKHRPRDASHLYGGEFPFIQTGDVKNANHKIYNYTQTYSEAGLAQSKLWDAGTLCITIAANIADTAILTFPACFPDSVLGFVPDPEKCDVEYVEYMLQFYKKQIQQHSIGSVQENINLGTFQNITFQLPDLPIQRRIAEILSALDDKIELNRRMNQTLEQMAQTHFRQYFVDGIDEENLPEGWQRIPIGEIIEFAIGGDWGKEKLDEQHTVQTAIIRGTDFSSIANGKFNTAPIRFIKEKNFIKRQLQDGDIIFEISGGSTDQPTGRNMRISNKIIQALNGSVVPASFCRLIRPKSEEISFYLSLYLQILYQEGGTWEYQNQSTGISNFQFTYFTEKETIAFPENTEYLKVFAELVRPIFDKVESNILEITTVAVAQPKCNFCSLSSF